VLGKPLSCLLSRHPSLASREGIEYYKVPSLLEGRGKRGRVCFLEFNSTVRNPRQ
jgi:hypothetical protein